MTTTICGEFIELPFNLFPRNFYCKSRHAGRQSSSKLVDGIH